MDVESRENELMEIESSDFDEADRGEEIERMASPADTVQWTLGGKNLPRSEIKYGAQILIIYVIILSCIINLSFGKSELTNVWLSLLCSCTGYILPSPYMPSTKSKQQTVVD